MGHSQGGCMRLCGNIHFPPITREILAYRLALVEQGLSMAEGDWGGERVIWMNDLKPTSRWRHRDGIGKADRCFEKLNEVKSQFKPSECVPLFAG